MWKTSENRKRCDGYVGHIHSVTATTCINKQTWREYVVVEEKYFPQRGNMIDVYQNVVWDERTNFDIETCVFAHMDFDCCGS